VLKEYEFEAGRCRPSVDRRRAMPDRGKSPAPCRPRRRTVAAGILRLSFAGCDAGARGLKIKHLALGRGAKSASRLLAAVQPGSSRKVRHSALRAAFRPLFGWKIRLAPCRIRCFARPSTTRCAPWPADSYPRPERFCLLRPRRHPSSCRR
jgi:hypothetical protein